MSSVFVTASGTGVGKTLLTCLAIAQLKARGRRVDALKPVVTGFDPARAEGSDPALLLAALGRPADPAQLDRLSPWRFRAALSPDMAAAREHRELPFDELVAWCRRPRDAGLTIIEGVGGVLVPIDAEHTVADWIAAADLRAVLVTGSYLGAISHTLTAWEALRSRGIEVGDIIVSASVEEPVPTEETARTIARFCDACNVRVLPRLTTLAEAPDLTSVFDSRK